MQVTTSVAIMQVLMFFCNYAGGTFCYSYVGGSFCCCYAGDCCCCNYAVRSFCSTYAGDSFCSEQVGNNFYSNYAESLLQLYRWYFWQCIMHITVCTCHDIHINHLFVRAIWDKLPKCIFEKFEIALVLLSQFQIFQKSQG